MKATLILCVALHATVGTGYLLDRGAGARKEKKVQYASWDDVNVIAHGLLQLGHGLKEHVDKTKSQIRDISTKMKLLDGTAAELGKQTQTLKADGEALRAQAQRLEERESQVLNISFELRERAEGLQKERLQFHERIGKLEEKVDGILQGEGLEIHADNYSDAGIVQWMLEAQNRRIDELVERIREQHDQLEKQNVRIRQLQSQIKHRKERSSLRHKEKEGVAFNSTATQSDSPSEVASDCHKLFQRGEQTSGVYTIQPLNSEPFEVFCEMTSEGGWTVIQSRYDGSLDFDQLWQAYQSGFGSPYGEFWLGLEKIHALSAQGESILLVELSDWRDEVESIQYHFSLGGQESNYSLHVKESSSGNLESALNTDASGLPFSTRDKDNDQRADINCAKHLSGGWWFTNCGRSNLNGKYFSGPLPKQRHQRKQGAFWKTRRGRYFPLKTTVMKMAPAEIEYKS